MALLVSGGLLLANGSESLDLGSDAMQRQIDNATINPLDPNLMREVIKALARVDSGMKTNYANITKLSEAIYTTGQGVSMLMDRVDKLEKEVAKLKKAKK